MKRYKKKTIALILASVVTVVGAFGAENYRNTLMSLKFESGASGAVNLTVLTKNSYDRAINPLKKDANTYVIMLPETNSKMDSNIDLGGYVDSIDVRTMPYTTNSKGYTKLTIKTPPNLLINAKSAIYIPEKKQESTQALPTSKEIKEEPQFDNRPISQETNFNDRSNNQIYSRSGVSQTGVVDIKDSMKQFNSSSSSREENVSSNETHNIEENTPEETTNSVEQPINEITTSNTMSQSTISTNSNEITLIILGVLLAIISSIYFFIKGKNKIAEIIGEQPDFEIEDTPKKKNKEEEEEEKSKTQKIKKTIKTLDKKYSTPIKFNQPNVAPKPVEVVSDENIVDLDEIYREKIDLESSNSIVNNNIGDENIIANDEEENSALEDFLSAYNFSENNYDENELEDEKELFDEESYNRFINDENLKFTKEDVAKIKDLLNIEIADDTIKNIEQYAVTNPIEKKFSRTDILENFVTTYAINQNITFSNDDIKALYKLINVELDNDFITDLRTNPARMQEMHNEIQQKKPQVHKKSEILTLNVKDMLPNLSEALKKQGGRKIESEYKPDVVYYSEGYDVSTISLKDQLPDLSVEINNEDAYISRPSDEIELVASGYDVQKLKIDKDILDLDEMLKHPEKYEEKEKPHVEIDEDALLRNISNVQFKPFYDGSEDIEILNNFEQNAPSVSDMQKEFNQLGDDFEIINNETSEIPVEDNENDDFESLFDNNYVDFDKPIEELVEQADIEFKKAQDNKKAKKRDIDAEKLINLIEEKQAKKKEKIIENEKQNAIQENKNKPQVKEIEQNSISKTCIVDNDIYEIVSTSNFTNNMGCYLAKGAAGYCILGFVGDQLFKIKYYEKLKSEKLQARISDKLDDGTARYIIRIGIHKFIMNVSDDNMEYVMDLC